jgi:hypothetical protein
MRAPVRFAVLTLLSLLAACQKPAPAASGGVAIPGAGGVQRPAGLWVERVSDSHGVTVTRYCLDAGADSRLSYLGRQLNGRCAKHDMAQAADGSWHFSTACDMGAWGKVSTEGVIRGDFTSHYTVDAQSQTVGAKAADIDGPRRIRADLRRVGDCPSGMKPGDVALPGGGEATVDQFSAPA